MTILSKKYRFTIMYIQYFPVVIALIPSSFAFTIFIVFFYYKVIFVCTFVCIFLQIGNLNAK